MGLAVKFLSCNGGCRSCYEEPVRRLARPDGIDLPAVLALIEEEGRKEPRSRCNPPSLHGGEPLLLPKDKVERILEAVYRHWGRTTVQTNGTILLDWHIEMFRRFKTNVGVSLDGDDAELNWGRWNRPGTTEEKREEMTRRVVENVRRLREAGLPVSIISVLRKSNASADRLPRFLDFLRRLQSDFGIVDVRTNEGIVFEDRFRADEELTPEEFGLALNAIFDECIRDPARAWQPSRDVVDLLFGFGEATCIFGECDIWRTSAEAPIFESGYVGNCLKGAATLDGNAVMRAETFSRERYIALAQTPQALGGCAGCAFWPVCKGGCPGAAAENDWRLRTRFCEGWRIAFTHAAAVLRGLFPNLLTAIDGAPSSEVALRSISRSTWKAGKRFSREALLAPAEKSAASPSGDVAHGDRPHGDSHGDHTDNTLAAAAAAKGGARCN